MPKLRCEFCDETIEKSKYNAHVEQHIKLRPDGQQTNYVTLLEEVRAGRSLDRVPQAYVHQK